MAALVNSPTGTDGVTVTAANSAAGGDAWTLVTIGTNASLVYATADSRSWYQLSTGATSAMVRAEWASISPAWARSYGRAYFRIPAASLGAVTFYLVRGRASTTQSFRISVSTGNRLQLRSTGNTAVDTGIVALTADTTYRVEWDVAVGPTATGTVWLYAGDSTTALELLTATADYGASAITEVGYGIFSAAVGHPAFLLRGFQANDTALPGPEASGPVTVSLTPAEFGLQAVPVTPVPQPVTVALTPAAFGLQAAPVTPIPQPVTVALVPAEMALIAVPVTPVPAPVTVALTPAVFGLQAVPLAVSTPGSVVTRPNTGTVTRPSTGTVTRPHTGFVVRP